MECSKLVDYPGQAAQKCREDKDHNGPCASPDVPRSVRERARWLEGEKARRVLGGFQGPAMTATEAYSEDGEAAYAERMESLEKLRQERVLRAANELTQEAERLGLYDGPDPDKDLDEIPLNSGIKRISPQEFRDGGYLQEANRLFFHPLGLALEVMSDEDGKVLALGGVWDYRDDPEGMNFGPNMIDTNKALKVRREWLDHAPHRFSGLGYIVQPVPGE